MSYPIPPNERARLSELTRLRSGEWGYSAALDKLCSLAAAHLGTPINLVSLVGETEQRFAAKTGIDAESTPRELAFCAHTIMTPEPLIVENASGDARFADNPLVTGAPGIGAYAGIPLETAPGLRIGSFCAIDLQPRRFSESEIAWLSDLASIAVAIIEAHRVTLDLDDRLGQAAVMQAELARYASDLERSNQELDDFAAVLSHDLKAPIRRIGFFLPQILEAIRTGDSEQALGDFEVVQRANDHMDALIDTLTGYCKLKQRNVSFGTIRMEDAVRDALDILAPDIKETGASISHEGLPEIKGNLPMIVQLLQNLISNAMKYCRADHPVIGISAAEKDQYWQFAVRDNGIGIEKASWKKIFDPFQRLHGSEAYDGIGLGLTTCRKIVERHAGQIWCESKPGEGASFYFTLPRARA